jgi:hypothetical protein
LDASAEEQRRVREIVGLFAQRESRDELGIGQIREVYSDLLFPGTSVIQTRARYLLFVPWLFHLEQARGLSGARLLERVQRRERRLVEVLRSSGEVEGLIGRRAGPTVKILPSTIYWSGLQRWGILTRLVGIDRIGHDAVDDWETDELDVRRDGVWHPTLPEHPSGFPDTVSGFELLPAEAAWLRERVLQSVAGTLLAFLVTQTDVPDEVTDGGPWDDPVCLGAPGPVLDVIEEARLFSLSMHGAALLYNLLVGERYEEAGFTRIEAPVAFYREALGDWAVEVGRSSAALHAWDLDEFWHRVRTENPRVGRATRDFVATWLERVRRGDIRSVSDDQALRSLVANRERWQKRAQARLVNDRLLRSWSGESGAARLTYRWRQVRRIIADIQSPDAHVRDAVA